ncbi:uncharacterized protein LOC131930226 [Physella acuta]|uniref:uncharacterized protein LOC131930226 n=1 Tax=Physella acuta TaxID=109671 RepID=UPI0027DE1600|nr:uncharacterized protein LOC131930226 [Physella acuta]
MILTSLVILLTLARMSECNENIIYSNMLRLAMSRWGSAVHSNNLTSVDFTFELIPFDTQLSVSTAFRAPELWFYLRSSYEGDWYTAMVGLSKNGTKLNVEFAKFRTPTVYAASRIQLRRFFYYTLTESDLIRDPPCIVSLQTENNNAAEGSVPACAFDFSPIIQYMMIDCEDLELRNSEGTADDYTGFLLYRLDDQVSIPYSFWDHVMNVRPCPDIQDR